MAGQRRLALRLEEEAHEEFERSRAEHALVAAPEDFNVSPEALTEWMAATPVAEMIDTSLRFFDDYSISEEQLAWLGDGKTSETIGNILERELGG